MTNNDSVGGRNQESRSLHSLSVGFVTHQQQEKAIHHQMSMSAAKMVLALLLVMGTAAPVARAAARTLKEKSRLKHITTTHHGHTDDLTLPRRIGDTYYSKTPSKVVVGKQYDTRSSDGPFESRSSDDISLDGSRLCKSISPFRVMKMLRLWDCDKGPVPSCTATLSKGKTKCWNGRQFTSDEAVLSMSCSDLGSVSEDVPIRLLASCCSLLKTTVVQYY